MQDYEKLYNSLMEEYKRYQIFAEQRVQELNNKNIKLEKNLDSLTNIVEISKYINTFFSNDNLISMINDMIIGILGVTYSTIFLVENNDIIIKSSNIDDMNVKLTSKEIMYISNEEEFLINSIKPIKQLGINKKNIHSIMGVPIISKNEFIGYIIVEHNIYNFMNVELKLFLKSIANQIAIALENSFLYRKLEDLTKRDALLGIYNRKYFFEFLQKKSEEESKFAIVMIDIDDFKTINDTCGHQFGDKVLKNTVSVIKKWIDKNDVIARYGGEEFILYISDFKNEDDVYDKVEIIRKSIEKSTVKCETKEKNVTASFGISFFPQNGKDANELTKVADDLLYKSKSSGKNRVLSAHIFKN